VRTGEFLLRTCRRPVRTGRFLPPLRQRLVHTGEFLPRRIEDLLATASLDEAQGSPTESIAPSIFNPKYRFDNFVVGMSNEFAQAAAQRVAENPSSSYNRMGTAFQRQALFDRNAFRRNGAEEARIRPRSRPHPLELRVALRVAPAC
jgi:hypothetical protein